MEETISLVIDAFDSPAYVLDERGAVVLSNVAARRADGAPPCWLAAFARGELPTTDARVAAAARFLLGARVLLLVVPRRDARREAPRSELLPPGLSPRLRQVADLILSGCSDREVALQCGLTVASARTYVARLYRRLGVSGRGELLKLVSAGRPSR